MFMRQQRVSLFNLFYLTVNFRSWEDADSTEGTAGSNQCVLCNR